MVFTGVAFQLNRASWRKHEEKRAAVMVGVLIGVFVLCCSPFFLTELIRPLCACSLPTHLEKRIPVAWLLQLFLQSPDLHGIEQELQQCLQETSHQAEMNPGLGETRR